MGFLIDPDQPVIWRGPMLNGVIRQFLYQVQWGELDYLIVDMPPRYGRCSAYPGPGRAYGGGGDCVNSPGCGGI